MGFKHIVWLFLFSCLMVACRQKELTRTEKDANNLISIEDSMETNPSYARKLLAEGMKNAPDSITYYEYMARLGRYFCLSSTPDSMTSYVDRVITFGKVQPITPRRNSLLAYAYNSQAVHLHNFHKDENEVIRLYSQAYQLLTESDAKEQLPNVCANLGDAYIFKNDLPKAASWYRKALFLVDSLKLPKKQDVTLYLGLGHIYLLLNDFDASLKCYQQTERHFGEMTLNMQAYFLNNYGNYYYYAKNYTASLRKFLQLKELLEQHHKTETFGMYLCKLNLSDVCLNLGQIEKSESFLDEVEPYMRKNGDATAIYYCNTIRIGIAVRKGDMNAVSQVLASEKLTSEMDFSLRQIRNNYLRKYYEAKGDYRLAYNNLQADNRQNDSLEHKRTNMRSAEIMQRFAQDTLMLHHRIAIEQKNVEIQESRTVIIMVVALLVILSLVIALLIILSRRKQEKAKLDIMQLKLDSVRNRISPHFIFNVLNNKIINSGKKESEDLLRLAKLIRANLDMSCQMEVSLKEELEFVRHYVEVESLTNKDDIDFVLKVDENIDLEQVKIPSMLVQIMAENALVHGLRGWEGKKQLSVLVAELKRNMIQITVADNGPGFDARTMVGKHHMGLRIISQTISVINERNKCKMSFQMHNKMDAEGKVVGCEAILLLPRKIHIKS